MRFYPVANTPAPKLGPLTDLESADFRNELSRFFCPAFPKYPPPLNAVCSFRSESVELYVTFYRSRLDLVGL